MSHFVVLVLVDRDADPIGRAEELLAPYSEEIEVEPYETDCWCIGLQAEKEAAAAADQLAGTLDSYRERYWRLPEEGRPSWEEFISPWTKAMEAALALHPLQGKPNPDCPECKGSGIRTTTYNPKSKWDWYSIGGRWDGILYGYKHPEDPGPFGWNVRRVADLPADIECFAIVTPDGEWHEEGKMGWWAIVTDTDPDWKKKAREILDNHKDCLAVAVDCHI